MAIRFFCPQCRGLLSIGRRKAGTEIQCPKCGYPQTVPSEEAAAAAMAMQQFGGLETAVEVPELAVYDDEPVPLSSPRGRPRRMAEPAPIRAATEKFYRAAGDVVVYPRQTLYYHAMLFPVVALVAFAAGYLIGRGDASYELFIAGESAGKEEVLVEGRLVYDPGTGKLEGDGESIAILLPRDKRPKKKFSVLGIRPHESPAESHATIRGVRELGGVYARAKPSGAFDSLALTGKYYVLLISRHADRPAADLLDELDKKQIGEYFDDPATLIRDQKYHWTAEEILPGQRDPIEHSFGLDEN